jgi:hypothetical protein
MEEIMTKVIKDSLTLFQTNFKKIAVAPEAPLERVQNKDQNQAVVSEVGYTSKDTPVITKLSSKDATLFSHLLADKITHEPTAALSSHRLTYESLSLLKD